MKCWQFQQAKALLSTVIKEAMTHGSQEISLHGIPVVVVLAKKEYDKLTKSKISFVKFMRQSPFVGLKIKLQRNQSLTRNVDF